MRIAHIVSTFPPLLGGMGSVCADEAAALAARGHEVTVFTLKYPHILDLSEYDKKFNFKVVRIKPWLKFGDAGLAPQLAGRLRGFDLAHLHYPFYGGAEWAAFIAAPLLITYHMDAQLRGVKFLVQKIYDLIWPKILFAKAQKIISVDEDHSRHLKFYGSAKAKLVEIPNGVDTVLFKPGSPDLAGLNLPDWSDKKVILFVGNTLPIKRLDLLLTAFKILNDKEAVLLVVGDGYNLEKYRQMTRNLAISESVYFTGNCDDKNRVAGFYQLADCFVMPSDYESFSLALAEAMASGVPVVGSNIEVVRNRIQEGEEGFLFAKGSAESLAVGLKKILSLSSEERKAMGQKGRAKMENKYSWEKHMAKLEEVYKEVLKY